MRLIYLLLGFWWSYSVTAVENTAWQKSYHLESVGNYSEAISVLNQIAATSADAEFKLLRRGWLFYLAGQYDQSIREYRFAIDRNKLSLDAQLGITLPLLAVQRWREAEEHAREILRLAPNHYLGSVRLLVALEGREQWQTMQQIATKLVRHYPSEATAYLYLARAEAWLLRRDAATAAYIALLTRSPGHTEALAYLDKQ